MQHDHKRPCAHRDGSAIDSHAGDILGSKHLDRRERSGSDARRNAARRWLLMRDGALYVDINWDVVAAYKRLDHAMDPYPARTSIVSHNLD
jgi:hypothetical protein